MWGRIVTRSARRRILQTATHIAVRGLVLTRTFLDTVHDRLDGLAAAWADVGLRMAALWRLYPVRGVEILRLPLVRRFSGWLGGQADYMQIGLIAFSLALAFLLAVAAGYIGVRPPAALTAKAEAPSHQLTAVLYEWLEQRPALPSTACGPAEPPAMCGQRLAADAEKWQARFAAYVTRIQAEQRYATWKREGKDFPTYNRDTGIIAFTLTLEGDVRGDAKTCLPSRVIAEMPRGITTGLWPDQANEATAPANIRERLREGIVKPAPFPHPCLRATEWTAWARIAPAAAQSWTARAKEKGWRLEMFFRLDKAESPLRPNWNEDARLTDSDFLKEQRIWLWVDEVRLVIGDLVVHRWR